MEDKGLLGEHPLVASQLLRERVHHSEGAFRGSILLGMSGDFQSSSEFAHRVAFCWQYSQGSLIFSEVPLNRVEVRIEAAKVAPTVEFEFDADQLVFALGSAGARCSEKVFRAS